MICKGCNKDTKLVKSHIIPESFYRVLRGKEETLKLVPTDHEQYPKRAPIGVYDPRILCGDCESLFKEVDDYAANVLINHIDMEDIYDGSELARTLIGQALIRK